ncbi:MAG: hypothetical protein R3B97_04720 [Dehalococcoidia bacterium]|nr:hypothetical protein [Dehalococcoidia bacterium]MCB9486484.1 hypothetical protein [Thermoflexaceae bacterium]
MQRTGQRSSRVTAVAAQSPLRSGALLFLPCVLLALLSSIACDDDDGDCCALPPEIQVETPVLRGHSIEIAVMFPGGAKDCTVRVFAASVLTPSEATPTASVTPIATLSAKDLDRLRWATWSWHVDPAIPPGDVRIVVGCQGADSISTTVRVD